MGAWNSRNCKWDWLTRNTEQFIKFIEKMGFDKKRGIVRSHQDKKTLVISGIISKYLKEEGILSNSEATDVLYDKLQLRGHKFGIMIDVLYTVADILQPIFSGKKHVLVLAGLEEHYFVKLGRLVLQRMQEETPNKFVSKNATLSGLYAHIIPGFPPYPKMSKSIPASCVKLDQSKEELRQKLVDNVEHDEIVMQLIKMVSDWDTILLKKIGQIYNKKEENYSAWVDAKKDYFKWFFEVSKVWAACA